MSSNSPQRRRSIAKEESRRILGHFGVLLLGTVTLLAMYPEFLQALEMRHPLMDFLTRHELILRGVFLASVLRLFAAEGHRLRRYGYPV